MEKYQERAGILFCTPHMPKAMYDHEITFYMADIKTRKAKIHNVMPPLLSTTK
jgi:hypothetical protein